MFVRIWIVVLALLLLAAPAGANVAEIADAETAASMVVDDDELTQVMPATQRSPDRTAIAFPIDHSAPANPALTDIFRPPRPSFD